MTAPGTNAGQQQGGQQQEQQQGGQQATGQGQQQGAGAGQAGQQGQQQGGQPADEQLGASGMRALERERETANRRGELMRAAGLDPDTGKSLPKQRGQQAADGQQEVSPELAAANERADAAEHYTMQLEAALEAGLAWQDAARLRGTDKAALLADARDMAARYQRPAGQGAQGQQQQISNGNAGNGTGAGAIGALSADDWLRNLARPR